MSKIEEIEQEIKKLEEKEYLTYDICQKLAILYIVKDHMAGADPSTKISMASPAAMMR